MAEQMVAVDGVEICAESFGDPGDAPILLIMGIGASMLWWDEGFCRRLADGGRFVIRYDHRDTGRSTTYDVGRPGYTGSGLVDDAARVLDAYGIPAAHVVGVSAGGAFGQLLALDHPQRVLSLVLISTTRAVPGGRELPPPTEEFGRFVSTSRVDWSDTGSVIDYLVGYQVMLAGTERPPDEAAVRDLVRRDVERARDIRAVQNHNAIPEDDRHWGPLSSITAPTLVIHGTADPLFPLEHGVALAEEIPGADFVPLKGAGHGLDRADWEAIGGLILDHTRGNRGGGDSSIRARDGF
ncbi:alpha/beta fold hydrolase [Actinomadura geliboluensis]|uniref:alpha/beta fold hydrolase n=1 Tax=Actinomadura geliboluensis TaxID=882440 RepID=UPI00368706C6